MANKVSYVNGATIYDDQDVAQLQTDFVTEGVADGTGSGTDVQVSQRAAGANMSVDIAVGRVYVDITWSGRTLKVRIDNLAIANAVVDANSSGSNRIDAALAVIDTTVTPNAAGSNIGTLTVLKNTTGTPTVTMSDGAITGLLGHANWYRIANITVANGATSITNANISDTRQSVGWKNVFSIYELAEQASDPAAAANKGKLYSKDYSGRTELVYRDDAGNVIRITNNGSINVSAADEKVKISNTDTTTDYLFNKIAAGAGITLTKLNPAGNEQLQIATDTAFSATFTAGEALTAGNAFCLASPTAQTSFNSQYELTTGNGQTKVGQKIVTPATFNCTGVIINSRKLGAPSDNLVVRIETDSAGSPSGTLAHANATAQIAGSAMTVGNANYSFTMTSFSLVAGTYWIVIGRSGANDESNYYRPSYNSTSDDYALGSIKKYNGSWAVGANYDMYFEMLGEPAMAIKTKANDYRRRKFIGFAKTSPAAGATFSGDLVGKNTGQSGLTAYQLQYLSDTLGAISSTPGTKIIPVARALSATEVEILEYASSVETLPTLMQWQMRYAKLVSLATGGTGAVTDQQSAGNEFSITTGSTSGSYKSVHVGGAASALANLIIEADPVFSATAQVTAAPTTGVCYFGFGDCTAAAANLTFTTDGFGFRLTYAASVITVEAITFRGGGLTATTVTSFYSGGAWNNFCAKKINDVVQFFVNNKLAATHTTDIPIVSVATSYPITAAISNKSTATTMTVLFDSAIITCKGN